MGRITRSPPKPKLKYPFEVSVAQHGVVADWIWDEAARVGGFTGYQKKQTGWATKLVLFDTQEKADELRARIWRRRRDEELWALRGQPCPIAIKYRRARDALMRRAGKFLPATGGESHGRTNDRTDEAEIEEFTDELSDEPLDSAGAMAICCVPGRAGN
jgi:hypothetical protein